MAWPALDPGRLLERCGDVAPRRMTVHDRTRLTGRLRHLRSAFALLEGAHALYRRWRYKTRVPLRAFQIPAAVRCLLRAFAQRRHPRFVPPVAVRTAGPAPGMPHPCGCRCLLRAFAQRRHPRFIPPVAVQTAGPAPGMPHPRGCRRAPLTQGGLHSGAMLERRVVRHRWNCCRWNCLVMTAAFCSGLRRGMAGPDLFAFHRLRGKVPEGRMGAPWGRGAHSLIRRCAPPSPAGGEKGGWAICICPAYGSDAWARPFVSRLIVPPRSTGVSKSPAASRPERCRSGRSAVRG